jgi:dolichol-phosphate mannosyltransferase
MQVLARRRHDDGHPSVLPPRACSASVPDTGAPLSGPVLSMAGHQAEPRARVWVLSLILILGFGIFHLVYSSFVGLAGDEAYYWQWSRHLDWGYYDHPPMVAYLIALGVQLVGHAELGVRLVTVLLSSAILWLVYRMTVEFAALSPLAAPAGRMQPSTAGLWAVIVLIVAPLFGVGGFLATPDIPVVFFWTLSIALTWRAVRNPVTRNWVFAGLAIGLGMLSKYSMVILPVALVVAFAATHPGRRLLRTRGPWIAAGSALLVCAPHLLWLAQHDFVSVLYQLDHGFGTPLKGGQRIVESKTFSRFLAGQAGAVSPILFLLFMWVLGITVAMLIRRHGQRSRHGTTAEIIPWLLVLPATLTLFVFAFASFFAKPQTNWPAAAYPTLSVFLGLLLADWAANRGVTKALAWTAVGLAMLVTTYAHIEAAFPILPYGRSVFDKLQEKQGLANWLDALRAPSAEKRSAAVLAENYRLASLLAFYLPDRPRTDAPYESGSGAQYTLWRTAGRSVSPGMAWYVTRFDNDRRVKRLFHDSRLAGVYVEKRSGVVVGRTYAYFGRLKAGPDPVQAASPKKSKVAPDAT